MGYSHALIDKPGMMLVAETVAPIPTNVLLQLENVRGITDQGVKVRVWLNGVEHSLPTDSIIRVLNVYFRCRVEHILWARECNVLPEEHYGPMNVVTVVQDYIQRKLDPGRWQ